MPSPFSLRRTLLPFLSLILASTLWGPRETDPLIGFFFQLEAGEAVSGYFTNCSGIGSSSEVVKAIAVVEGVETAVKIPGALTFYEITLSRGITSSMDTWTWRKQVEDGLINTARTNISVIMVDQALTPIAQWNFENAWPSKIELVSSSDGTLLMEVVTLTYTAYQRVQ